MTRNGTAEAGLIEEKELSNRMRLRLYDRSRRIAGDRWLIRLHGEGRIAIGPELFTEAAEGDAELLAAIRERLGGELVFTLERERHFVAEEEKQEVLSELLARVQANLLAYLESPAFPAKLFRRRCQEQKARIFIEREQERRAAEADTEEDEGPADFSFCFRDGNPGK
ncbi:MAG: hypothetical protein M0017_03765 [Desulfobacteraceae bacterium]|nr:hypothetical protein [Desulfobacteraceae bacterium]